MPDSIFFPGGEVGALMRAKDWASSPLGPIEKWPQSLRTAVRIILQSRYAMFVWWGKDLINLYNDSYSPFLGKKHPAALGRPAYEAWNDIWDQIGPRTKAVMERGESTFDERLMLMMDRHGYLEETYFTFSYSPLPDDVGGIGGLFCAVTEDTERVLGERRLRLLRKLALHTQEARTAQAVCRLASDCLKESDRDLPFALIYLLEAGTNTLRRAANAGIEPTHAAAPESIELVDGALWDVTEVMANSTTKVLDQLPADLPTGAWTVPPREAFVIPLAQQGQEHSLGVLIAGANPHRVIDEEFTGFVGLLASQLAASIASANAYQTERKRAEMLAELDRAKTTFFSNVSHEFRTPITLLLGPLEEALLDKTRPENDMQRLETAHRNGLRLLKLVNSLLDFSRIEAGREQATYERVDIAKITRELASGFRSLMEQAGLKLTIECPDVAADVFVDREMWEKIVLNLLSNAYKFTLHGEVHVTQVLRGKRVHLSVRDTGTGIPERELPNVFKRFHRVEGARGRSFEGTGIGLALVQELVKLHGGTASVESEEGIGTTFTVSIPTGKAHLPEGRILSNPSQAASPNRMALFVEEAARWTPKKAIDPPGNDSQAPRAKLLVVDDNSDMRDYIGRLLSDDYDIRFAHNGIEAIDLASQDLPDLVLTDVMMPELDGVGLVGRLRKDPRTSTVPIIMLSARAGEEARIAGLESGADDYLTKPFTAAELIARVATHIKMSHIRREAELRERSLRSDAEKAQAALLQTEKLAAMGRLAASIAHEINNPLEAVTNLLYLIESSAISEEVRNYTRMADQELRRVGQIATQTLRFHRQSSAPREVKISGILESILVLYQGRLINSGIRVERKLRDARPVHCLEGEVRQTLTNLIGNAVDAMPFGGRLLVRTKEVQRSERRGVVITIADTGQGIAPAIRPRLFEAFFTTKGITGTGLGLWIAKAIVDKHKGEILVRSSQKTGSSGTVFQIFLPFETMSTNTATTA